MSPIPARYNGIDHVVLRVTDLDRTLNFYKTVLGLTVERIFEKIGLYQIRCGANLIDISPLKPGESLAEPRDTISQVPNQFSLVRMQINRQVRRELWKNRPADDGVADCHIEVLR